MRIRAIVPILLCIIILPVASAVARTAVAPPRGTQPTVLTPQGKVTYLYEGSYAFLVSVSSYEHNKVWKSLPKTESELDSLSAVLQEHGFQVTRVKDPNGEELARELSRFLGVYGRKADARIVVVFSGHGHMDDATDTAYFVPRDAGSPDRPESNFYSVSLALDVFRTQALGIKAKHGLFVFDNCFSGMIFRSSAGTNIPAARGTTAVERWRYLDRNSKTQVRQFISAGGPDSIVPGSSIFAAALIEGLRGAASRVNDGYVTGKELGMFVSQEVTRQSRTQQPQSDLLGKHQGDMVFQFSAGTTQSNQTASASAKEVPGTGHAVDPPTGGNIMRVPDSSPSSSNVTLASVARPQYGGLVALKSMEKQAESAKREEAAKLYRTIAEQVPHWYFPARRAEILSCADRVYNAERLDAFMQKWSVDDHEMVACQYHAYSAAKRNGDLDLLNLRTRLSTDKSDMRRTVIVSSLGISNAMGQWRVKVERDGDTINLLLFDGWVAGVDIHEVTAISVGVKKFINDRGEWNYFHKRECLNPVNLGFAKGSTVFAPVAAPDFKCTVELEPGSSLIDAEILVTFIVPRGRYHLFAGYPLALGSRPK